MRRVLRPERATIARPPDATRSVDRANLIAHAESAGIAVTWSELDASIGGFVDRPQRRTARRRGPRTAPVDLDALRLPRVTIGDVVVVRKPAQAWAATLEVLLHELAHAQLSHLRPAPSVRQGTDLMARRAPPPWEAREFEADVAAQRRGSPARRIGLRIMLHFASLERDGEVGTVVDLLVVFRVVEAHLGGRQGRSAGSAPQSAVPSSARG